MARTISLARVCGLLLATFLISLFASCSSTETKTSDAKPVVEEKPVISFSAYDPNGGLHHSSEWIGKGPVVINFWGTWCGPCRREIPDLVRVYDEYKAQGIEVISLAVKDDPERVKEFAAQYGMDWVQLMADPKIVIDYQATVGIPTTIFLDSKGHEVQRFIGWQEYEDFEQAFGALAALPIS